MTAVPFATEPGRTACIATVGCRLNQAESDLLRGWLQTQGFRLVNDSGATPDLCFVNTCAVTANAEKSSLALIRSVCSLNPKPRVIVFGCLPVRAPELLKNIPGIDEIWTAEEKKSRLEDTLPAPVRSRALLKVQDGCDRTCSFCIVRQLRGAPAAVQPEKVLSQFQHLRQSGYQEIVLTGLNLGRYESGNCNLARLLQLLLAQPGRFRLRLASIEPDLFTDELLTVIADPRICSHFHIPLQSGDDRLLAAMDRRYRTADYARLINKILQVKPDACIGADVIVGYPGEDELSFTRTLNFLNSLPLHYLHVFPYSPRPGTRAFELGDPVPKPVKQHRVQLLRHWSDRRRQAYARRFISTVREAVLEPDGRALTDNYLRLTCEPLPAEIPAGRLVRLVLKPDEDRLAGTVIDAGSG
ncbi:MAG: radical SAM protein [candidate division WOR-3 bacterium]